MKTPFQMHACEYLSCSLVSSKCDSSHYFVMYIVGPSFPWWLCSMETLWLLKAC